MNAAVMPTSPEIALARTSSRASTVRGSTAPFASSTNREDESRRTTPAYASTSERHAAAAIATPASKARHSEAMISVRRRSQRSIKNSAQRADQAERQQGDSQDPRDSPGRRAAADVENDQLCKGDLGQTIAELA